LTTEKFRQGENSEDDSDNSTAALPSKEAPEEKNEDLNRTEDNLQLGI